MKNLFSFLLIVLCLACDSTSKSTIKFTSINGKINHSKNDIHPIGLLTSVTQFTNTSRFLGSTQDGIQKPNYLVALDTGGNFRVELPIKKPTEMRLQYGGYSKILYVEPAENLTFNKTVSFDFHPNQTEYSDFDLDTLIGTTAEKSLKMNQFDKLFNDSFKVELDATLSYALPREFKTQRAKITKRIRRLVQTYIEEHATDNPILANWVIHHSEYRPHDF